MAETDVRGDGRALEHLARRLHPGDLEVAVEALAAETHGGHRHAGSPGRQQGFGERSAPGVGSVAYHHEARERGGAELLAGAVEGGAGT